MNSNQIVKGIKHIYNNDVKIARIIDIAGTFDLKPHNNYYYSLLKAIVGQQLSVKAASSINKKFFLHFNNKPSAQKIYNSKDQNLRNLGLSWAKVKYVKDLSLKIINKEIHFRNINNKSNEEIKSELTKVKGIGVWTVDMFLIFTLVRLDVLPINDLGLRKAIKEVYGLRKLPDEKKIVRISKQNHWEPYFTIASWYLWRSLEI
ncbi:MAG TPA: DNA-3-methyladenine glycosylase 2 family protein [Ignavibacteria bacterium]|nr:DNA-3-methyladenine glycosylase 2 family protein [Ignavibacteria bacterium]